MTTFWTRLMLVLLIIGLGVSNAQLSANFYSSTCPLLLPIVRTTVLSAMVLDPRMGASLLRLHYTDCFVNGCDASVLLDDTADFTGEKTADLNINSLRGFNVINTIKNAVNLVCAGVVSCADILSIAGRDGVVALGGPSWPVALGRRDSTTASWDDANNQLPGPETKLEGLIDSFAKKGFTADELIALSGAHTIGRARCVNFFDRIYGSPDNNIDPAYAKSLREICPNGGSNNAVTSVPLDITSPNVFNNDYFGNLVNSRGLLSSDQELSNYGDHAASLVNGYSINSSAFFNDFASAMIRMSNLGPLTGTNGQIRTNCSRIN